MRKTLRYFCLSQLGNITGNGCRCLDRLLLPRETARWLEYPQYAHRDQQLVHQPLSDELPDAPVPESNYRMVTVLVWRWMKSFSVNILTKKGPWSKFETDSPKSASFGDTSDLGRGFFYLIKLSFGHFPPSLILYTEDNKFGT